MKRRCTEVNYRKPDFSYNITCVLEYILTEARGQFGLTNNITGGGQMIKEEENKLNNHLQSEQPELTVNRRN